MSPKPLSILVDIGHPAHVHFFRNAIDIWMNRGHEVTIFSRDKDITLELLDQYQYQHFCVSRARRGLIGLARELLEHEGRLYLRSLRNTPDIFLAVAGVFIVHAAKLVNKPSLVFYDTEIAKLSNAITYPFATAVFTPSSYLVDAGRNHFRYNGFQELAYLHPNYFSPDPKVVEELGINPGERFFLVRFVSWEASHDVGHTGFSIQGKRELVNRVSKLGRVIISSEARLPVEFEDYNMTISPTKIHHLLSFCTLFIGESATMATESAILGTPFIYVSPVRLGTIEEEEVKYGMGFRIDPSEENKAINLAEELAQRPNLDAEWQAKRKKMLEDTIDVTSWMVETVENYAFRGIKGNNAVKQNYL